MSDDADSSTGSWTRQFIVQRGASDEEWRRFHARYAPQITAWCRRARKGLSPQDYENAAQDALLRVWNAMQRGSAWDPARGTSFRAWLRSVARNALCDYLEQFLRRAIRVESAGPPGKGEGDGTIVGTVVSHELAAAGADAIEQIGVSLADRETVEVALARTADRVGNPQKLRVFELWFVRGLRIREIAEETGRTDCARISREKYEVKQVFRRAMVELGENDPFPEDDSTQAT
jgi:RNA polymerase sigma factor (sigma-70 family)